MQVSNAQHQAITHGAGPAIVLAGPGSGKTLVITQRVRYLIEAYHVRPQEILVITFTKAAAQEMQSRFQALSRQRGVTFGTFHAVFFHILKYAYHYNAANILTEEKKYQILQRLLSESGLHFEDEKETLSEIASEISVVKNEQIPLEHYYSKSCPEEVFRNFYRKYEEMHRREGLLDFDDMMTMTYELLTQRADILAAWQRHYRYILVDEFQDINLLQYAILRLLANPERNLFIVGDDDQSIYRFRGAKPEIMLNFPKDYPDAKQIVLDRNFRSVASVIRAAQLVIRENTKRFAKRAVHVRKGQGQVDIREFSGQEHESLYLIKKVQESLAGGTPPNEIAVLYRTNQGARPYAERLMEFNIPFEMRDALPNIYEHWIAKDLFAYLHLARERLDRAEFLQVMNRPKRYIARDAIDAKVISLETLRTYYEDKDWMLDRIDRLELDLRMLKDMAPYAAVNYIRYGMNYEEYLQEYAKARRMKPEELTDILDEIQDGCRPFKTVETWYEHLTAYKERLLEQRGKKERDPDAITLATLHSAKGLEFQEVFLVDVNEGTIPHRKASMEADLEEERRLFYVGMTRAKDRLHLFYVRERYGKRVEPSAFLEPLLEETDE